MLLLFYVDTRRNLKAIRGKGYHFVHNGGRSLPKTIMLVVRSSGLWEAYTQTCPKWYKNFTTTCWYRSMIACQVSWISDEFLIYYNLKTRHLNVSPAFNGALVFEIHSHFLAWDQSMHQRTPIWVFNHFICTGACACSSNLNYAHKCIEYLVNA